MYDICCVGHLTSDKNVTPRSVTYMAGGTAFYFSNAISRLDLKFLLFTALAPAEMHYVNALRETGIEVNAENSAHTVYFENIYDDDPDHRTQNVWAEADPFVIAPLLKVDAQIFHLGPLLAGDISTSLIKALAVKGRVSIDVQGYLRKVIGNKVYATDWPEKKEALQYVDILKADEAELQALTGCKTVADGCRLLTEWGVKEAVITNGSKGSVIYGDGIFHTIPAYRPDAIADTTGCGDTYMAGYLYKRLKGATLQQAGEFAAAMAGLKTATPGPFTGTEADVMDFLEAH